MNTHKLFLISALLLIGLIPLQAQKRIIASAGVEMEDLPVKLMRHDAIFKKQFRLEFQSAISKRLFLSTGVRYSWNSEEFEPIPSFTSLHPHAETHFHVYSFSSHSLAIPIGLSYDLIQKNNFPLSVYANLQACFNRGHYDDYYFENEDGPDTSIGFEGGFRFPLYSGQRFGVFISPYMRFQNRTREDTNWRIPQSERPVYETSIMQVMGLRVGLAIN